MIDKKLVVDWLSKAEEDFNLAVRIMKEDNYFSYVCFHFQQSAEKFLKSFIIANELKFVKVHNLIVLLEICKEKENLFETLFDACSYLNAYYIDTRYLVLWQSNYNREDVQKAKESAEKIKNFVREKIKV